MGTAPLTALITAEIQESGPMPVSRFMALALGHPIHGYYPTRDPLGMRGDFTTAPEISPFFGEIIGLWLVDRWLTMGQPDPTHLIELGPGRGTLMRDILRAARVVPRFADVVQVHFVETSPILRAAQRDRCTAHHPAIPVSWHDGLATIPPGPSLIVANEFFDALPIEQWVFCDGIWHERRVALAPDGGFCFVLGAPGTPATRPLANLADGALFETCEAAIAIGTALGRRLRQAMGAALLIDYGHGVSACGDTVQAVRGHRPASILSDPGTADLTAHVDFMALASALAAGGAQCAPLVTQGDFLTRHGIAIRAAQVLDRKSETEAASLAAGMRRLIAPDAMGRLFKVLVATTPEPTPTA